MEGFRCLFVDRSFSLKKGGEHFIWLAKSYVFLWIIYLGGGTFF